MGVPLDRDDPESGPVGSTVPAVISSLLSIPHAVLLGIVEGITEFLPVSSTGHLIVVGGLIKFGVGDTRIAGDTYSVAIQFGAILAVLVLYRRRIWSMVRGLFGRDREGRGALTAIVAAFLPAAVLGVVVGDAVKDALFGPVPVMIAWFVGGVALLVWQPKGGRLALHEIPLRSAVVIGLAQALAFWPGVSRSLVTIVGGVLVGLSLSAAVEFSFLLGLITLSAATFLDLAKHGGEMFDRFGTVAPLAGLLCAFVTALVSVRWMVQWLNTRSLRVFGWYRVGAAVVVLALVAGNRL